MGSKRTLGIAVGAAVLVITGIAIAADRIGEKNEVSEQEIALSVVPQPAMAVAKTRLASVTSAELVRLKDGRTVYGMRGKDRAGETAEFYVSTEGQVVTAEGEGDEDDD